MNPYRASNIELGSLTCVASAEGTDFMRSSRIAGIRGTGAPSD